MNDALRLRLPFLLALTLVFLVPSASAELAIEEVNVPDRTLAGQEFNLTTAISNDGPAREVYLFAALYDRVAGKPPCGQVTDPSFRTFTHILQERVHVAAHGLTTYPSEGGRWQHRYQQDDATPSPEIAELCVFLANATQGPAIEYEAFRSTTLSVRSANAAPVPRFDWSPERPAPGQSVEFRARATDAEGDPVRFLWDFGHADAGGRATGEGALFSEAFYPAGSYVVTLVATDDLTPAPIFATIEVVEGASEGREGIPFPFAPALAVVLLVALQRKGR